MMPAGFYYKTMHKPAAIWPMAMKQIRKAAGLGVISADYKMKGKYDESILTAEVTVIGGGAAGMSAALGRRRVRAAGGPAGIPSPTGRMLRLPGAASNTGDGTAPLRTGPRAGRQVGRSPNIRVSSTPPWWALTTTT
jgi:hypothetical protein